MAQMDFGEALKQHKQQQMLEEAGIDGPKEIEAYFSTGSFHELFDFAKQYSNLDGVAQIVESGKQRLVKYDNLRKQTVQDYQPKIDSAFSNYQGEAAKLDRFKKLRKLSLILFPVTMILSLFSGIDSTTGRPTPLGSFFMYVSIFDLMAIFAFVVLVIVFNMKAGRAGSSFRGIYNEAKGIATNATSQEEAANDQAMKAIDDIYLSTLSIADREAIITRRLQQQQLQEQRAHNQRIEASRQQQLEEQRAHNQQMEEDQRAHQQQVENEQRIHNRNVEDALNRY